MRARVLCVDPPWAFKDRLPGKSRGAGENYPLLTTDQLVQRRDLAFQFPDLEDDGILFLWRVASMVEDAYRIVRAWDYDPKSEIVWNKLTKNGKPWFGMGRTVRNAHETCVVATRGRASRIIQAKNIRSTFEAPVPVDAEGKYIHSAKPEFFYTEIVQRLVNGPYVELFARRRRPGWVCLGNDARLSC